jgi:crossover junction endodeoxyribonuclease RuvC
MIYIGIDPGKKGGIATVGITVAAQPMPMLDDRIDSKIIADRLRTIRCYGDCFAAIEKVASRPDQGVVSMFNFGEGYGRILGVLDALNIQYVEVLPQAWKKVILPNTAKDKIAAIGYCKRHYPDIKLILPGCRNSHDGMADALCLARYAELFYEKNKDKINARNTTINAKII